jgi:hypothetical protein
VHKSSYRWTKSNGCKWLIAPKHKHKRKIEFKGHEKLHVEASLALDVLQYMKQISQLEHPTKSGTGNTTSFPTTREKGGSHHEERVGGLDEALLLVLELLELRRRVEQVDVVLEHLRTSKREHHVRLRRPKTNKLSKPLGRTILLGLGGDGGGGDERALDEGGGAARKILSREGFARRAV